MTKTISRYIAAVMFIGCAGTVIAYRFPVVVGTMRFIRSA